MNSQTLLGILLLGVLAIIGGTYLASADTSYEISIADSIDTPDKTVTLEGNTHTVSAVKRVSPGEQVEADVTAPSDTVYRVYLYDGDRQIVAQERGDGPQKVTFDMSTLEPGSYMLAVSQDGEFKSLHPVVIRGYQVDLSSHVRQDSLAVNVSLINREGVESPSAVRVVVTKDDIIYREEAERETENDYRATISLADAPKGEYRVYAIVQGSETAFNGEQKEILGISDSTTVDNGNQETIPKDTSNSPSQPATTTAPQTATATTVPTTSPTTALNETSTFSPTHTTTPDETLATKSTQTTDVPTKTSTTQSVITPTTTNQPSTTDTPTDVPVDGFGIETALVALCSGLYLHYRRL